MRQQTFSHDSFYDPPDDRSEFDLPEPEFPDGFSIAIDAIGGQIAVHQRVIELLEMDANSEAHAAQAARIQHLTECQELIRQMAASKRLLPGEQP